MMFGNMLTIDKTTTPGTALMLHDMNIPSDNRERWEWVKYQLRLRGSSLSQIARDLSVDRSAPARTVSRNYPKMQNAIASALGMNPQQIWPERYPAEAAEVLHHYRSGAVG